MSTPVSAHPGRTARQQLEHELRRAEQRYAEIIEHAPVGIFRSTEDGRLLMANPALARMLGYDSPAELLTLDLARDVYRRPEERAALVARQVDSAEPWSFELEWRKKDGTPIWVLLSARGVRDDAGRFVCFESFVQDVTERRIAEARRAESEERLRAIVETEPECVKLLDRQGHLLTMNPAGLAMIEAESLAQVAGTDILSLVAPEDRAAFATLNERVFEGESGTLEFDLVGLRGARRRLETHAVPLRGATGEVTAHLAVTRDVSERGRAEERFRRVFETAAMGIAIVTPDLRLVEVNQAICALLGYTAAELVGRTFVEITYPDDVETDRTLAERVFRGEIPHYRIEKRYVRKDGGVVWGLLTATVIRDAVGTPLYGVGIVEDITERKRAEEALRNVAEGVSAATGDEFFRELVLHLPRVLEADHALVGELVEGFPERVRTLAMSVDGAIAPNAEYELRGTPCENVVGRELCVHPDGVQALFPTDRLLAELGAVCYIGTPLFDGGGRPLGLVAVLGRQPLRRQVPAAATLRIFAARASAELERLRAQRQLARSSDQLRRLAARLEAIREEERTRIARDIHDQFGQTLTALKMDLAWLRKKLPRRAPGLSRRISDMDAVIHSAVAATQRLVAELRPGVLDDLGLFAAVRWLAEEFGKHTEIPCAVHLPPDEPPLGRDQAAALFRILQETLTNVARHARADRVAIALHRLPDALELVVTDDGRGITPRELDDPRSLGILGIRERAHSWGGQVSIHGAPGRGTTVRLFLPIAAPARRAEGP